MSNPAVHSEVKFKVRRNALLLGEFTIAQLVRATGLNPESVRTEVQRLRQEGMIASEHKPGQREALYRLSDDAEKRLALSRNVEAFYPEPPEPIPPRPTSRLYQDALETLDEAEREKGARREILVRQAAYQLEGAWQAEGAGRAPELVQAHLFREQGRVACLEGRREQALERFSQARDKFSAADAESEIRLIDEYLSYLEARRQIDTSGAVDAAAQARCVVEVLEAAEHLGPLTRLLVDLARDLSRTTEEIVTMEVYKSLEVIGKRIAREVRSEVHEELRLERELMPSPMVIGQYAGEAWPGAPSDFVAWEPPVEPFRDLLRRQSERRLDA